MQMKKEIRVTGKDSEEERGGPFAQCWNEVTVHLSAAYLRLLPLDAPQEGIQPQTCTTSE